MQIVHPVSPPCVAPAAPARSRVESREAAARLAALAAVVLPLVGVVIALVRGIPASGLDLALTGAFYLPTAFGITAGYHGLFAHRSHVAPRSRRIVLGVLGAMALQGPIAWWVAQHRREHARAPHDVGPLASCLARSYLGPLLRLEHAAGAAEARDVLADPVARAIDATYGVWVALSLCLPFVLGALLGGSLESAMSAFLWAGLVRLFGTHHATWVIDVVAHRDGIPVAG